MSSSFRCRPVRWPSRGSAQLVSASLAVALVLGCSSESDKVSERAPLCKLGDACSADAECTEQSSSTDVPDGPTVTVAGKACVRGRCVDDLCAATVDPEGCCYPDIYPEDLDGTWNGSDERGEAIRFDVEKGVVVHIEFDWAIQGCTFMSSDDVSDITGHSGFDLTENGQEPLFIDVFADSASLWYSSLQDPAGLLFYVEGTFTSVRQATITVEVRTFCTSLSGCDPDYGCEGNATLEFDVRKG
jgi:hypothetical protein